MYKIISNSGFKDEFRIYDRADNFSDEALDLIYDYYEEIVDYELDVIAICCAISERDIDTIIQYFNLDIDVNAEEDDIKEDVIMELSRNTAVIGSTIIGIVYFDY